MAVPNTISENLTASVTHQLPQFLATPTFFQFLIDKVQ